MRIRRTAPLASVVVGVAAFAAPSSATPLLASATLDGRPVTARVAEFCGQGQATDSTGLWQLRVTGSRANGDPLVLASSPLVSGSAFPSTCLRVDSQSAHGKVVATLNYAAVPTLAGESAAPVGMADLTAVCAYSAAMLPAWQPLASSCGFAP